MKRLYYRIIGFIILFSTYYILSSMYYPTCLWLVNYCGYPGSHDPLIVGVKGTATLVLIGVGLVIIFAMLPSFLNACEAVGAAVFCNVSLVYTEAAQKYHEWKKGKK